MSRKVMTIKAESAYDGTFYQRASLELNQRADERGLPTLDELMWRGIKYRTRAPEFSQVPWGQCWYEATQMGFPMKPAQQEQVDRWLSLPRSETGAPETAVTIPALSVEPPAIRCEKCHSTGRTEEGSYCTCTTGRDLARVEAPREISDANEDWDALPESNL